MIQQYHSPLLAQSHYFPIGIFCVSLCDTIIMRPSKHNILHFTPTNTHHIHEQLRNLHLQNQELIRLAQTIHCNSIMLHQKPPHIIARIEEELRRGLTIVVQGIHEVYKDMDRRLRIISQSLQQLNCNQNSLVSPYQSMVDRIASLEEILRNTQQNEAKLLRIIEKLESRGNEQPSNDLEIRQLESKVYRGFGRFSFEKSRVKSTASESSFRLFSLNNPSEHAEKQPVKVAQKNIVQNNPFSCMGYLPKDSMEGLRAEQTRMDLHVHGSQRSYTSNHNHRLNFMMNTLGD